MNDVGLSIVIFICALLLLLLLFYLVTRYFNYRLQKSLLSQNEIYSMVEELTADRDEIIENHYENFAESKVEQWDKKFNKSKIKETQLDELVDSHDLKKKLSDDQNTFYGIRNPYRMMDLKSIPILQESKSSGSHRFDIQTLDSFRSGNSLKSSNANKNEKQQTVYKYISQIVHNATNGINILKNNVREIWKNKQTGQITKKSEIVKKYIGLNDESYKNTMQAYGFDEFAEEAYKFEVTIKINNMKQNIGYWVNDFKKIMSKQEIEIQQFYRLSQVLASGENQ